jgi:hypothetical protein
VEIGLLIHLASKLQPAIFPPTEFCPAGFLYILERGLVIYAAGCRRQGTIWGEDVLLNDPELECGFPAVAVSYTWVLAFDGKTLNAAIQMFPASKVKLDFIRRRWSVRRCLVREAEIRSFTANPPTPFRGRMYPIYAKETAKKMKVERQRAEAMEAAATMLTQGPNRSPVGVRSTGNDKKGSEKDKLAAKHARAATMAAAADYGMQMRMSQMLQQSRASDNANKPVIRRSATGGGGRRGPGPLRRQNTVGMLAIGAGPIASESMKTACSRPSWRCCRRLRPPWRTRSRRR